MENKSHKNNRNKTFKIFTYFFIGLFSFVLISFAGLQFYLVYYKTEIISEVKKTINKNITGVLSFENMDFNMTSRFPYLTVILKNISLTDSLYDTHKRKLLEAKEIDLRLDIIHLLRKEIRFDKVFIDGAKLDFFKDINGINNSNIFKLKTKKSDSDDAASFFIQNIEMKNVSIVSENQPQKKHFDFETSLLKIKIQSTSKGLTAKIDVSTLSKKLIFNTKLGSFIKDQKIVGTLEAFYDEDGDFIDVRTSKLKIGTDFFDIKSRFNLGKNNTLFNIDITTKILWSNAYKLLTPNISNRLQEFDIKKPIGVRCVISGDMNVVGDPMIVVTTKTKDNIVNTPNGNFTDCSFAGKFTNNFDPKKGNNDINSAVIFADFKGFYKEIPIIAPKIIISNFENTIVSGIVSSNFKLKSLKDVIGEDLFKFYNGQVLLKLKFKSKVVNMRINKPQFSGVVSVKGADLVYLSKKMAFKSDLRLEFTDKKLLIQKIALKRGSDVFYIDGSVENFLNLYYNDPEKIIINLNLKSPSFDVKELIKILAYKNISLSEKSVKKPENKNTNSYLTNLVKKSRLVFNVYIQKSNYKKLQAKNISFKVLAKDNFLSLEKGKLEVADGNLSFDVNLKLEKINYEFQANLKSSALNLQKILLGFDNFGIKSFQPKSVKGILHSKASLKGNISPSGNLVVNSLKGDLKYELRNIVLEDFKPIINVGQFVFPNRNLNTINIKKIFGNLEIDGEKVHIKPSKINSSILNFDVMGTYSFGRGTNIGLVIPLRNPKKDNSLSDKIQQEKRYKGIVIHLLATDRGDGSVKLKLGKYNNGEQKF